MPKLKRIKILRVDSNGYDLDLGGAKNIKAYKSDVIEWSFTPGAGIKSIDRIVVKNGSTDVFSEAPVKLGENLIGKIKDSVVKNQVCEYAIHWTNDSGEAKVTDPIITIKPSLFDPIDYVENTISLGIGAVASGIALLIFWRKERMAMKREIEILKRNNKV